MLVNLYIKNIALISKLNIDFHKNINIFSGETGAGKSIIIDSLNFMLGAKTDKSLIRHGEDSAVVEGLFEIENREDIAEILEQYNVESSGELLVSRSMSLSGRNDIRLNGKAVTLTMLREITHKLVDVHGQSEHFMLSKVSSHIELLDKFGNSQIASIKEEYQKNYDILVDLKEELSKYGSTPEERQRQLDLYAYQIAEIEDANIGETEEDELNDRFKLVTNAEKIASSLVNILSSLSVDSGAIGSVSSAQNQLSSISNMNDKFDELSERLKSVKFECMDIESNLMDVYDSLNFDSNEADRLADRLDKIKSIKRKYGKNYNAIMDFLGKAYDSQDMLKKSEDEVERLSGEIEKYTTITLNLGDKLSKARKEQALIFEQSIILELGDLGMANSKFVIQIDKLDDDNMTRNGLDEVEFMFSANVGEPIKPLIKVISGGEMSRFMLALKSITSEIDNINTMIFDEIDTGISGKIAHVVAEKFIKIGESHQLIIITHLPQIGATSDNSYLISKGVVDEQTYTSIKLLTDDEKLYEISRLSGGTEINIATIDHSKQLIKHYDEMKSYK